MPEKFFSHIRSAGLYALLPGRKEYKLSQYPEYRRDRAFPVPSVFRNILCLSSGGHLSFHAALKAAVIWTR